MASRDLSIQSSCPMCGRVLDRGASLCSDCGEHLPAPSQSVSKATRLDTVLGAVFGSIAVGLCSVAVFRCYQFLNWRLKYGPRAQEFAEADTLFERIAIAVDFGRTYFARTGIYFAVFIGIPVIVLIAQVIRQHFGARRLPLRRVFWITAAATWAIILTLLLITFIDWRMNG